MLALNYTPYFDLSELTTELTLPFTKRKPLTLLAAGQLTPEFTLQREHGKWQQFFKGKEVRNAILLRDLLAKPLVIAFYSQQWKTDGLELLTKLNVLQQEINASGGNLLVISSDHENTEKLAWDNSLSLNFYFDNDHGIAEKFRIYSDSDPIWNRFSGIDINVPLLATYVISPTRQIVHHYIEEEFAGKFPSMAILNAVQQAAR